MKIRSVWDMVQDAKDVIEFFDGVETPEQMVSKLERLKKRPDADDLLACVDSLKVSMNTFFDDTIEMSGHTVENEDDFESLTPEEMSELGLDDEPAKTTEEPAKDKT